MSLSSANWGRCFFSFTVGCSLCLLTFSNQALGNDDSKLPLILETPPAMEWEPSSSRATRTNRPIVSQSIVRRGDFGHVQVNIDEFGNNIPNDAANEPSIAVDPNDPMRIAIGWRQFDSIASDFRQAGWAFSDDGGVSWTSPGVLQPGVFRSDPVLESDADGIFFYYSLQQTFVCDMYQSADGGMTWPIVVPALGGDKAWFTIDTTGGMGRNNIYVAWSNAAGCCGNRTFTRSTDGGFTWMEAIRISQQIPIWGTLDVGSDGAVFVSGQNSGTGDFLVARSSNAQDPGQTPDFESAVNVDLGGGMLFGGAPNPGGLLGQVNVAVDRSIGGTAGNVYLTCSVDPTGTDPLEFRFSRSQDNGETWSEPVSINDDGPTPNVWQWFGTLSVAPNGRIDAIWNDTRNTGSATMSELMYANSFDGGVTWSENVVMSDPWNSVIGWPVQQKIGDYYDMISDETGFHLAWSATFNGEQDVYYLRAEVQAPPADCEGDANGDEVVDPLDSGYVQARFGCPVGTGDAECDAADVNADGLVDPLDVGFVLARFGECG